MGLVGPAGKNSAEVSKNSCDNKDCICLLSLTDETPEHDADMDKVSSLDPRRERDPAPNSVGANRLKDDGEPTKGNPGPVLESPEISEKYGNCRFATSLSLT